LWAIKLFERELVPFQNIVFEHHYRSFVLSEERNENGPLLSVEWISRRRGDRMVCVNFESAVAIVTRRNQDGVSRLANRLRTDLGEVEQDRDQDDREYFAAREGNAGRDEDGLQSGHNYEKF
jgi:hypothetical protein